MHGNIIQIYSTSTFENVSNLKGHNGKVRAVIWSPDDSKIVSCGMDGAVYEWDSFSGKRVGESVLKSCSYTSVATTPDCKTTFAVGSDKTLKEIADSQILRDVDAQDSTLTAVAMSHSGRMLFAGTSTGTLRSFKYPLTVPGEWIEYQGHSSTIIKMKITFDDQYLVTVSEDACVMIWKIQDKEGRGKRDKEVGYAEEILITKSDLEEKVKACFMQIRWCWYIKHFEQVQYKFREWIIDHKVEYASYRRSEIRGSTAVCNELKRGGEIYSMYTENSIARVVNLSHNYPCLPLI